MIAYLLPSTILNLKNPLFSEDCSILICVRLLVPIRSQTNGMVENRKPHNGVESIAYWKPRIKSDGVHVCCDASI